MRHRILFSSFLLVLISAITLTSLVSAQEATYHLDKAMNIQSGSWDYATTTINSQVASYIQGWTTQKIIGKSIRVLIMPENMPNGPYTISGSYYLVP